jgi:hypothetical protein
MYLEFGVALPKVSQSLISYPVIPKNGNRTIKYAVVSINSSKGENIK